MEEQEAELRRVLSANIKKYRGRRAWSQIKLAEKLDISSNFLANIETGKSWVSPLTLVKLSNALGIEVFELFKPEKEPGADLPSDAPRDVMLKYTDDLTAALDDTVQAAIKTTIAHVKKQYLA